MNHIPSAIMEAYNYLKVFGGFFYKRRFLEHFVKQINRNKTEHICPFISLMSELKKRWSSLQDGTLRNKSFFSQLRFYCRSLSFIPLWKNEITRPLLISA